MHTNGPSDLRPLVTLLVSILLVFVVYPFVEHLEIAPLLLQLLFTVYVSWLILVDSLRAGRITAARI
jgi:hypothetical protein